MDEISGHCQDYRFAGLRLLVVSLIVCLCGVSSPSAQTIGYWRFEEGIVDTQASSSAGAILDSSGNNLHGTALGNPFYRTSTAPANTLALELDGSGDYVRIVDNALFEITQDLTLEAYITVNTHPSSGLEQIIFRGDNTAGFDPYFLALLAPGLLYFQVQNALNQGFGISSPTSLTLGQLTHVAATLEDSTGDVTLYVNKLPVATGNTSFRPFGPLAGGNPRVVLGALDQFSAQFFDGLIHEARISNAVLMPNGFVDVELFSFGIE